MKSIFTTLLLFLLLGSFSEGSFKDEQLKYPRVRTAYAEKEAGIRKLLASYKIELEKIQIYIRAFKSEEELELWGKNKSDKTYKLLKTYKICDTSGELGPKRKQGDFQIPEGYYRIDRFNPYSSFYLSLGINYPNKSDRIFGYKPRLGGDIFIHGDCVTIGCLPLTDTVIKELYIFCVEAKNNGQQHIPVTLFPAKLDQVKYDKFVKLYKSDTDKLNLWADLKNGYDFFNTNKTLPEIEFLSNGRVRVGH